MYMNLCGSVSVCAFYAFSLAPFLLYLCLCFILFCYDFLEACFLMRGRKAVDLGGSGGGEDPGGAGERINYKELGGGIVSILKTQRCATLSQWTYLQESPVPEV